MLPKRRSSVLTYASLVLAVTAAIASATLAAPEYKVLHAFAGGTDVATAAGGYGVVYEMTP